MYWIGAGSLIVVFFSIRAYLNNAYRWRTPKFPQNYSRMYFYILQGLNILLVIAGVLFLMLSIVCQVKRYHIQFLSSSPYRIEILTGS